MQEKMERDPKNSRAEPLPVQLESGGQIAGIRLLRVEAVEKLCASMSLSSRYRRIGVKREFLVSTIVAVVVNLLGAKKYKGHITHAASDAELDSKNFFEKMKKHRLSKWDFKD